MKIKIELIAVPGCDKCACAQAELRAAAISLLGEAKVDWREVNVLDDIDYAVSLGMLSTPAVAVNGKLVLSSLPTPEQLRRVLESTDWI